MKCLNNFNAGESSYLLLHFASTNASSA